jgi:hypothetical protein
MKNKNKIKKKNVIFDFFTFIKMGRSKMSKPKIDVKVAEAKNDKSETYLDESEEDTSKVFVTDVARIRKARKELSELVAPLIVTITEPFTVNSDATLAAADTPVAYKQIYYEKEWRTKNKEYIRAKRLHKQSLPTVMKRLEKTMNEISEYNKAQTKEEDKLSLQPYLEALNTLLTKHSDD